MCERLFMFIATEVCSNVKAALMILVRIKLNC